MRCTPGYARHPDTDLIQTDHLPVAGTVRLKMRKPTPSQHPTRLKLSKEGLISYKIEVNNRFALLMEEEPVSSSSVDSEARWQSFKKIVSISAKATLARRPVPKKPWILQETMSILEQKRKVSRNIKENRAFSNVAKKAVQKDRKAVKLETCAKICEANWKNDSRGVCAQLNKLTSKVAPTSTAMKGPTDKALTDTQEILESWRVYCDNLHNEENVLHTNEAPESVEMEPIPWRSEVAAVLKSISTGKAVGWDEIPIELLQQGGEKVIDILHWLM